MVFTLRAAGATQVHRNGEHALLAFAEDFCGTGTCAQNAVLVLVTVRFQPCRHVPVTDFLPSAVRICWSVTLMSARMFIGCGTSLRNPPLSSGSQHRSFCYFGIHEPPDSFEHTTHTLFRFPRPDIQRHHAIRPTYLQAAGSIQKGFGRPVKSYTRLAETLKAATGPGMSPTWKSTLTDGRKPGHFLSRKLLFERMTLTADHAFAAGTYSCDTSRWLGNQDHGRRWRA